MVGKQIASGVFGLCLLMVVAERANGQLFGERRLGQALEGRRGGATLSRQARRNARFMRGNRAGGEFVGNTGRDGRPPVPTRNQQPTNRPPQPRVSRNLNPVLPKLPGKALYYPKLSVPSPVNRPSAETRAAELSSRLTRLFPAGNDNQFEVLVAGRTATLRGAVASAHHRELAEIVVRFSPGIYEILNELTVRPAPPETLPVPPPPE